MRRFRRLVLFLVTVGAVIHFMAKSAVDKIKQRPERYDIDELRRDPQGETHFISCEDGTILRAVTAGNGSQTVVFTHGYAASLVEWNLIWNALLKKGGYRLIAWDLRGHEKSQTIGHTGIGSTQMAADLKQVLDYFDARDALLVSHSTGCFLTAVYMLNYPESVRERIKGAVLMGGLMGKATHENPQNAIQIPLIQSGLMEAVTQSETYGLLFAASLYGDDPTFAPVEVFREQFSNHNHQALIPLLEALVNEDYYPRLQAIDVPCVVVCGENDQTTPRWHSEQMGERIPNARSVWIPDVGHMLNWEAPEVIVEAIESLQ